MPRRTAYANVNFGDPRGRNRPRELGPVRIYIKWYQVLIALISLTIGGVIRGILGQVTDHYAIVHVGSFDKTFSFIIVTNPLFYSTSIPMMATSMNKDVP